MYVAAFALVFRTNVAYNRYWESCTQAAFMAAKWGDTVALVLGFDMFNKPPQNNDARTHRQRRLWQALIIHRASLLHALSMQYLRRDDDVRPHPRACPPPRARAAPLYGDHANGALAPRSSCGSSPRASATTTSARPARRRRPRRRRQARRSAGRTAHRHSAARPRSRGRARWALAHLRSHARVLEIKAVEVGGSKLVERLFCRRERRARAPRRARLARTLRPLRQWPRLR